MADEPIPGAAAPAAVTPAPTPAAAPAPAPAASPAPAPAPASVESPAPAAAPPAEGAAPAADGAGLIEKVTGTEKPPEKPLPGDEPTLLETVGHEKDEKTEKPGEKPAEEGTSGPKIEFQPFKAPEGIKLDDARISDLNEIISRDLPPQERRDTLINMHIEEMKRYDSLLRQNQQDAFRETRTEWRKQLMADPELGGSGFETTKLTGAEMRDLFASRHRPETEQYKAEMKEFNDMLRYTGVGDHPAFWRLLNNVGRKFKEPSSPKVEFQPPPDLGQRPGAKGRRGALYDHPTSNRTR